MSKQSAGFGPPQSGVLGPPQCVCDVRAALDQGFVIGMRKQSKMDAPSKDFSRSNAALVT